MKSVRTLAMIIPAVVVLAAIVGFFITFPSSPQAAYARIFIDLGVLIALMSACMTIPKPRELRTGEVADGLRDLAQGRYDKRLNSDFEELSDIAQAFNELAGSLSDSGDPNINRLRSPHLRKSEVAPRPILNASHSHHPELGPVQPVAPAVSELNSASSQDAATPLPQDFLATPTPVFAEQSKAPEPPLRVPTSFTEPEMQPIQNEIQDLYAVFCEAHQQQSREPIDFDTFQLTIDQAREDLLSAHRCRSVRFEVVMESGQVALRPRLVR